MPPFGRGLRPLKGGKYIKPKPGPGFDFLLVLLIFAKDVVELFFSFLDICKRCC
jgi:hypothetical protein